MSERRPTEMEREQHVEWGEETKPPVRNHPISVDDSNYDKNATIEHIALVPIDAAHFTALSGWNYPSSDWRYAYAQFQARYGDGFDMVVFFTEPGITPVGASGFESLVYNEVSGIGLGSYNIRSSFNSDRLQCYIWMGRFSIGTLLQEVAHRWGAFVGFKNSATETGKHYDLSLPDKAHWAPQFDDGKSPLDYDALYLEKTGTNNWKQRPVAALDFRYCDLDLYLMGILKKDEVEPFYYITNFNRTGPDTSGVYDVTGTQANLTIQNIVWAEGDRVPDALNSERQFRIAFALITRNPARADEVYLKKMETFRRQFEHYFGVACRGRACADTRLFCSSTQMRTGVVTMTLPRDQIIWSPYIYHGLGPIPVDVRVSLQTSIGGAPIDDFTEYKTPDITGGVQHLAAQANRTPYDGRFRIVGQAKGNDLTINVKWWAMSQ